MTGLVTSPEGAIRFGGVPGGGRELLRHSYQVKHVFVKTMLFGYVKRQVTASNNA